MNPSKAVTQLTKLELADVVKNFYMTTRKKDGNPYKLCSYLAIRRCLSLIFQYDYGLMHVDISCDPEFLAANVVFSQMSHSLRGREENFGVTESWRLTPEKLKKLYTEGQLDFYNTQNPKVLLQTVYFYVCYYTGIGKLSVMRQVVTNDVEEVLENGRLIAYNFNLRKYLPAEKGQGPFTIYEIQGKPWCPILTIREYMLHRNKSVQSFFQKPLSRSQCYGSSVWFKRSRFKEIFPLASMCREAHIDPPLTSGCFSKSRISAEIRYEMSFVYAKLFPQCFSSSEEIEQRIKLSAVKKKRTRKYISTNGSFQFQSSMPNSMHTANLSVQGSLTSATQSSNQAGYDLHEESSTPPSMVVSRSFDDAGSLRQPYEQGAASNENPAAPVHQVTHIGVSSSNILQPSEIPSISVTNVYSCRRDVTRSSRKQSDALNIKYLQQPMQNGPLGQPDSSQTKEIVTSKENDLQCEQQQLDDAGITDDHHDIVPTCQEALRCNDRAFTRDSSKSPQMNASYDQANTTRYSSINGASHHTTISSNSDATTFEPQVKRSRFDTSSHTFLREISASAREQGKGAVMLLLSLLDDLSNNRGNDLLRDILQEMKII